MIANSATRFQPLAQTAYQPMPTQKVLWPAKQHPKHVLHFSEHSCGCFAIVKLDPFQEYALQFLLPHALSQAGSLVRPLPGSSELRPEAELAETFREAYTSSLNASFKKITSPRVLVKSGASSYIERKKAAQKAKNKSMGNLSLVDDNTLALQLMISRNARDLHIKTLESLQFLSIRLERLAGQEFEVHNNPLHPALLGDAMKSACDAVSKSHTETQAAIERWLALAAKRYETWLDDWNQWLANDGVMPWLAKSDIQERYLRREEEKARAEQIRKEVISSITGTTIGEHDPTPPAEHVMQKLSELIKHAGEGKQEFSNHILAGDPLGREAHFEEILTELEKIRTLDLSSLGRNSSSGYIEHAPITNLTKIIKEYTDLGQKALDSETQGTTSLVSMLFERFLGNEKIAAPIRSLMAGLQVPMLQSALTDANFLIDSDSPAQKMLNLVSKLGVQWNAKDDAKRDTTYQKLESIVTMIQDKAREGEDAFEDGLFELERFMQIEEHKAALLNERAVATEQAKARMHVAARNSQTAIRSRINGLRLPENTAHFIQHAWQKVLFFLYNKDPEANLPRTREGLNTLESLLGAAQGKTMPDVDAMIRKFDAFMIEAGCEEPAPKPKLTALSNELKTIAEARKAADLASAEVARLIEASESHADAQNDTTPAAIAIPVSVVEIRLPEPEPEPEPTTVETAAEDDFDRLANTLCPNSWFMYHTGNSDSITKIKLAAIIKHNLTYVFVSREGIKVLHIHRSDVAAKLRNKELLLIESGAMYENTLANIITAMRH